MSKRKCPNPRRKARGTPRDHRRAWTPQDDAQLMDLINRGVPRPEVAKQIGRTLAAMNTRLQKIRKARKGEGKMPDPSYNARYEQWEFNIVFEQYPDRDIPVKDIAAAINRSVSSIYRMAAMLGVRRTMTSAQRATANQEQQRLRREQLDKEKDAFKKGIKHDLKKRKARVISDNPWANIQGASHVS